MSDSSIQPGNFVFLVCVCPFLRTPVEGWLTEGALHLIRYLLWKAFLVYYESMAVNILYRTIKSSCHYSVNLAFSQCSCSGSSDVFHCCSYNSLSRWQLTKRLTVNTAQGYIFDSPANLEGRWRINWPCLIVYQTKTINCQFRIHFSSSLTYYGMLKTNFKRCKT